MGTVGPKDYWVYDETVFKAILIIVHYELGDGTTVHYEWSTEPLNYVDDEGLQHKVDAVIKSVPSISSAIESSTSGSSLVLQNFSIDSPDGTIVVGSYFDDLLNTSIEGRPISIYLVDAVSVAKNGIHFPDVDQDGIYHDPTPDNLENARFLYVGVIESISASSTTVTLELNNPIELLDTDIQYSDDDFYTGIEIPALPEYDAEKDKKVKPITYGHCFNIPATVVDSAYDNGEVDSDGNAITGTLYQICGTPVDIIWEIRENGSVIYNEWQVDGWNNWVLVNPDEGTFIVRQGTIDGHGLITCDVYGKISVLDNAVYGTGYPVHNVISIVRDLIYKVLGPSLAHSAINNNSFDKWEVHFANELNRSEIGIYIDTVTSALSVINELLASVRGYLYINEYNKISVTVFEIYDASNSDRSVHTIDKSNIISGSYNLTACEIPNTKIILKYKKNYTPQDRSSLADIVINNPYDEGTEEYDEWVDMGPVFGPEYLTTYTENNDPDYIAEYKTAKAADEINTLLYRQETTIREAESRMLVRDIKRKIYTLKVKNASIYMRVGDFIIIKHFLYNSSNNVNGTIIGLSKDFVSMITTIEVFV